MALGPALSRAAAAPAGLTLEQALALALQANPRVLAAALDVQAAAGRALELGARPEPQLLAAVEGARLPGAARPEEGAELHLGVEQLFEFPGKRALRLRVGRLQEQVAVAELERVKLVVAAAVKRAYWRAAYAVGAGRLLDGALARADLLLEDLQARYRAGTAAYADVLRARAERARLRNQALEQEKEGAQARLELNTLLARPGSEPVELASPMSFTPLAAGLDEIWDRARSSRPSLRIAALQGDLAQAGVRQAALSRRPDLTAGFALPSVRANAWGLSLGLSLPFLRPARPRGAEMAAGAGLERARLDAAARERSLHAAVLDAYAAARAAGEQVRVFERDLLVDLRDELRLQHELFRFGKGTAFELLDLQRTLALVELEHLRAVYMYVVALADLEAAGEDMP
jgi:cobalt-zinc-cadmium efflux system outer membrane protein